MFFLLQIHNERQLQRVFAVKGLGTCSSIAPLQINLNIYHSMSAILFTFNEQLFTTLCVLVSYTLQEM